MHHHLITSESVTEGHPDKIADRISDAVLDSILQNDADAHVACETFLTTGLVLVGGEITTQTYVDVPAIVRKQLCHIGYDKPGLGFHYQDCAVLSAIKDQSPDIDEAVRRRPKDKTVDDRFDAVGAGDQGIMFGYACQDTDELMPLPILLAHRLVQQMTHVRKQGLVPFLRPDGKSQVTVAYEGDRPIHAHTVLLAAQHDEHVPPEEIASCLRTHVVEPVLGDWLDENSDVLVNTSGRFVIGGPASDAGVTGRKIIVDTYGGVAPHGGGAFSGKDPSKVDRSGAYLARYVAKHLVASGYARQALVQVAYAIGRTRPLAVHIDTRETGTVADEALLRAVLRVFDFRPASIIEQFGLKAPIYTPFSAYGHFGRTDVDAPWERVDRLEDLERALA